MTKRYAVLNAENIVANIAIADNPIDIDGTWIDMAGMSPEPGIGWSYVNGQFSPPLAPPAPPPLPNIITKVAMITRFTDAEFVAILTAAKTDVEVEGWYARFSAATTIDLDDPRTQAGAALLVSKHLLTQARASAILNNPVQPNERP